MEPGHLCGQLEICADGHGQQDGQLQIRVDGPGHQDGQLHIFVDGPGHLDGQLEICVDGPGHQDGVGGVEGGSDEGQHPGEYLGLVLVHKVAPVDGQLKFGYKIDS